MNFTGFQLPECDADLVLQAVQAVQARRPNLLSDVRSSGAKRQGVQQGYNKYIVQRLYRYNKDDFTHQVLISSKLFSNYKFTSKKEKLLIGN